jgi:phasin
MARNTDRQLEIPSELRAFTEKSVEQAKQAFGGFMSAAHRTMSTFEGQAASARQDARKLGEKAVTFAERNIASSFEFAQSVVRANNVDDMLILQADYIKAQIKTLTEQAKELGQNAAKSAQAATAKSAPSRSTQSVARRAAKTARRPPSSGTKSARKSPRKAKP